MNTYSVDFRTESHAATEQIRAKTAHAALAKARRAASNDLDSLWFQPYSESGPVSEIIVCDKVGRELAVWRDEDAQLRLYASGLLEAARAVLARWEHGDLAEAVRLLAAAVAKAEGAAQARSARHKAATNSRAS